MSTRNFFRFRLPVIVLVASIALSVLPAGGEDYELKKLDQQCLVTAAAVDRDVDRLGLIYPDPDTEKYLNEMARELLQGETVEDFIQPRVQIFRDSQENAFSLGNGSIYVSVGLIARLENEDQMAAVLSHEVSHVVLHHALIGYKDYVGNATLANIGVLLTGVGAENNALFYLAVNGYSRKLEKEADLKALELLTRAGYDPAGMIAALEILDSDLDGRSDDDTTAFWSNHPSLEARKEYLNQVKPEFEGRSRKGPQTSAKLPYLRRTLELRHQACRLAADARRYATSLAIAQTSVQFFPDDALSRVDLGMTERSWAQWAQEARNTPLDKSGNLGPDRVKFLLAKAPALADAEAPLLKASQLNPQCGPAYLEIGLLYEAMGRTDDALVNYQKFLDLADRSWDRIKVQKKINLLKQQKQPPAPAEQTPKGDQP